jgi:16S rRNA (guanine966-N2)-methyltransferase
MRIVTGQLKGRTIPFNSRQKNSLRLTSSMLKEAVFAMLGADLEGDSFLDLCAGSGQMGLEAYSRGACVALNEPDQRRCGHIRSLVKKWRLEGIELHSEKAQVLLPRLQAREQNFHIVYLDPPYDATFDSEPLSLALLARLGDSCIMQRDGLVLAQVQKGLDLPAQKGQLALQRQRTYGQTILGIYQKIA